MKDTEFSLDFVNYTCNYNNETKYSYWNWTIDGYKWFEELPECKTYCKDDPPNAIPEKMTRKWNGFHWEGSYPVYKCEKGLAFRLQGHHYKHKIVMKCDFDNVTDSNRWQFDHLEQPNFVLPQCEPICPEDPPEYKGIVNRTWVDGKWAIGDTASYVCSEAGYMFRDYYVYEEISFKCMLMPNETEGIWMRETWNGTLTFKFPDCNVRKFNIYCHSPLLTHRFPDWSNVWNFSKPS